MTGDTSISVAGKTIAVTGGSSGLGLRMVQVLAAHGANVVSISRIPTPENEIRSNVMNILADVTVAADIERAFDEAEQQLGTITVLFNNAGVATVERALTTTREQLRHIFEVNVEGAFFMAQEAAKRMIAKNVGGSIINLSSILADAPIKGSAAYAMSKAAISQMTRSLALEWAPHSIRVNAIAPGWFPTRLNETIMDGPAKGFLKGRNPMRRLGEPEDIDGAVLMLASDASSYITGTVITIDGGHSLQG
ncbi:SDR family NAD(P)-dependent oxidoreductase [Phyllobacterium zundukense]|uniref:2-deoxy-D-gluconate 3-dehydrogenase n=1 Tax=Phyllobacterium zundukense TaxID=1867719 RepID=A0A2N9VQE8_9HYPH|nr:SDR family oxidoreductase [Phyllobacterium zundukense]ATU90680.1 2-deoxy-D-gluconate 3-dehydrogenase [Phyllobacterium zundukense]PIO41716.1 2-deoxy-D-gluconate 3-dehydrogenase [Phyllobacterium zundukense]